MKPAKMFYSNKRNTLRSKPVVLRPRKSGARPARKPLVAAMTSVCMGWRRIQGFIPRRAPALRSRAFAMATLIG